MTSPHDTELRDAIALAQRRLASSRNAVLRARLAAEPTAQRRRALGWLVAVGALAFGGSFAGGRYLAAESIASGERTVTEMWAGETAKDLRALDRCNDARAAFANETKPCPHAIEAR